MKLKKYKVLKYYESDLWGTVSSKKKINKSFFYFKELLFKKRWKRTSIFDLGIQRKGFKKKKKMYGRLLFMKQRLFLYYGGIKKRYYRTWLKYFSKDKFLNSSNEFIIKLESQLDITLLKSNFVVSIYESRDFIKKGFFSVNKEVVKDPRYKLKVGDLIEVVESCKGDVYRNIIRSLICGGILHSYPCHLEVSYSDMIIYYISRPKKLAYLFKFNKDFLSTYNFGKY